MYSLVIVRTKVIARHVIGLGILAQDVVVVSCPRRLHGAQRFPVQVWTHNAIPDQLICIIGGRSTYGLLNNCAKDVRHRLVQRAGLTVIDQTGCVLCYAVRKLVTDHIGILRKIHEDGAVTIPVSHLAAIPEGVHVIHAKVDIVDLVHTKVVDRISPQFISV